MKKKSEPKTEKNSVRARAEIMIDQWLVACPEDHFSRPREFAGKLRNFGPADFSIGRVIGPFVEICAAGWASIFHIDEIEIESGARYYDPIRRLLELMLCHPFYWYRLHYALLHEVEKAEPEQRAVMIDEIKKLTAAEFSDDLQRQYERFRVAR